MFMFIGIDLVTLGFLFENGDVRIGKWHVTLGGSHSTSDRI